MKNYVVLWLTVGLSVSVLNPILTQTVSDKNLLLLEGNDSRTTDEEATSDNTETTENIDESNVSIESINKLPNYGEVQIVIEEKIENPMEQINSQAASDSPFELQEPFIDNLDNEIAPVRDDDFYYNDVINKDPNEIMDTAAGFVPIPVFRRRQKLQKPRKQFASRRYFKRPYAHRRLYYFNPYYRYYYPSSLRFY